MLLKLTTKLSKDLTISAGGTSTTIGSSSVVLVVVGITGKHSLLTILPAHDETQFLVVLTVIKNYPSLQVRQL